MFDKIDFSVCKDINDVVEISYKYFNDYLFYGNMLKLKGKSIQFVRIEPIQGLNNQFWHLTGLGERELGNKILPCINDSILHICKENCTFQIKTVVSNTYGKRTFCLYRASRLPFINEIIQLANDDNPVLNLFHVPKGSNAKEQLVLLVDDINTKYQLILEIHRNADEIDKFRFISAHPIFYKDVIREIYYKYNSHKISSVSDLFQKK